MQRPFLLNVVAKRRAFQQILSRIPARVRVLSSEHLSNCSVYELEVQGANAEQMFSIERDLIRLPDVESTFSREAVTT